MAVDLRKCYSENDLPTAPWQFPLSFIPFLILYILDDNKNFQFKRGNRDRKTSDTSFMKKEHEQV